MILVFGGTTEGKLVITLLEKMGIAYIYSTKTDIATDLGHFGIHRFGALSCSELSEFVLSHKITCCINASHPFATVLHDTVASEFEKLKLPVFRLQRHYLKHQPSDKIHYVEDYAAAISILENEFSGKRLLGLTGVQTIVKLSEIWKATPCYFRILDRQSSINSALESNFPMDQLILGYPNKLVAEEIELYKSKEIAVVLTKESGHSGSLDIKIDAAKALGIDIIIIKKPKVPRYFQLATNIVALESLLKHIEYEFKRNSERSIT